MYFLRNNYVAEICTSSAWVPKDLACIFVHVIMHSLDLAIHTVFYTQKSTSVKALGC